jgi:hypothetical protein
MKHKQVKDRIWALLLAMTLLISMTVPAVATTGTAQIAFGQVYGKAGQQITVPVVIKNNPGIASFRFRITYDPAVLTYVSATKGEAMTGGTLSAAYQEERQELAITWFDVKNLSADGVIFNLVFQVSDTADGQYPIMVSYLPEDIVNASWQQVDMTVTDGFIQTGSNISGTITSFGTAGGAVTVRLMQGEDEVVNVVSTNGNYCLETIAPGDYTLVISKQNHVTRTYNLTVTDQDVTQNVKIHLIGDIDGNGKVNVGDTAKVYSHVKRTALITDEYMLLCADIDGNGKINVGDTAKVYAHVKRTNLLW